MTKTVVLVGCGAMAKGWLKAITETDLLKQELKIIGLVDLSLEMANKLAEKFTDQLSLSDVMIGSDLNQVLTTTKPDILFDVVIPAARRDVVEIGLAHGCHVLSEKPMANSLDEAQELLQLANKADRIHAVVQNRRFISGIRRIDKFIKSGKLGDLTAIHCDFFLGAHFGGFRDKMQHVLLLDMAVHTFDAARFIMNKTPKAVYCQESNPKGSWYQHGAAANAIFEFSDNCTFTYRGSWCAEGANTSWESTWRVIGTNGTLLWDGADDMHASLVASDDGFIRLTEAVNVSDDVNIAQIHGHASVLTDFLQAVNNGTQPETVSGDNIKSLSMVFAAIESAKTQQRIEISSEENI
ncbi:MAG: Gfo/Idh/MocA family oxidoreductase [Alphaproteobacteria bacterium]|nr:Gfo/Idh/MocA family oxidoreductase [Alphaproteobacteria bacterium]